MKVDPAASGLGVKDDPKDPRLQDSVCLVCQRGERLRRCRLMKTVTSSRNLHNSIIYHKARQCLELFFAPDENADERETLSLVI